MEVNDLESEIHKYETLGFKLSKRFTKPGMKAAMLFKDGEGLELFVFENPDGETEQIIRRHEAFISDNLENDIQEYVASGHELVIPITQGVITKRFAFLKNSAGEYIELLEPLN